MLEEKNFHQLLKFVRMTVIYFKFVKRDRGSCIPYRSQICASDIYNWPCLLQLILQIVTFHLSCALR